MAVYPAPKMPKPPQNLCNDSGHARVYAGDNMAVAADRPAVRPASAQGAGWSIVHAAQRVGVSTATLRSWEFRYGIRPSARTPGGHRRYSVGDIASLQRVARLIGTGMPAADAVAAQQSRQRTAMRKRRSTHRTDAASPLGLAQRFTHAADMLNPAAAARAADALLDVRGALDSWIDVFAPYLRMLGRQWEESGTGIECEHIAVAALQTVLDQFAWSRSPGGDRPDVLLSATDTEHHTLPLHAAAAALAERNISARVLGRLPAESICATATALAPSAVLVLALRAETTEQGLLTTLTTAVPIVYAAGPGWAHHALPAAITPVSHLSDLVEHVEAWAH